MKFPDNDEFFLLRKIPDVHRARGFRLYLSNGKRLVDLWLNGGAAVLGHTPPDILRELKNTASRGLYAPFPHFSQGRYINALLKLLPGYSFRLYAAPPPPLITLFEQGTAKLWRPFLDPKAPFSINENGELFILVVPGIQIWRGELPLGLCVVAAKTEEFLSQLPPGDILPPVLLSVAARGVFDLLAALKRAKPSLPRTYKILKNNETVWQKQGIYLTLKEKPSLQEWEALFFRFLEAGFLLPPVSVFPIILPGELSDGEDAKLANALSVLNIC